jgi:fibronectin type 3 domain-containing protein
MAAPAIPTNFYVQQADGNVLLSWNIVAGATSYTVYRSTDGVTFSSLGTSAVNSYLDSAATINTLYYYTVASTNGSGTSSQTSPQQVVPTLAGKMSLAAIRLAAQQRADRENSNFVTMPEWNSYINQSAFELYDLLTTVYEDYNIAPVVQFQTDGSATYDLPNGSNYSGAKSFYKLMGVDVGIANNTNGWVTLKKFNFIARNRYVFPQITSTYMGVFNMQYRIIGDKIMFIPTPQAGQTMRLWYIPRMSSLLQDTDVLDGVSGWTEYVIVDAAIKALQKEESDVSVLMAEKQMLVERINGSAMNRDAGQPDTISNTRTRSEQWGGFGIGYDGSSGGM